MVLEELDMVQEVLDMVLELLAMVVLEVVPEFLFTLLKGLEVQLLVTSTVKNSLVKRNQCISKYMTSIFSNKLNKMVKRKGSNYTFK